MRSKPFISSLRLNGRKMKVTFIPQHRRTLTMIVEEEGLIIKMPMGVDIEKTFVWISSRQNWIEKRLKEIESMKLGENEIWYLGVKTKVSYGKETTFNPEGIVIKHGMLLETELREHAVQVLGEFFRNAVSETRIAPKTLRFRTMKRSWGRCTSKGEITLNTRLIACEPRFIICLHP